MNPLTSILGTIISGFVLAVVIVLALGTGSLTSGHSRSGSTYWQAWSGLACSIISILCRCLQSEMRWPKLTVVARARQRSTSMLLPARCCGSAGARW